MDTIKKKEIKGARGIQLSYTIPRDLVIHLYRRYGDHDKVADFISNRVQAEMRAHVKSLILDHKQEEFARKKGW